MLTPNSIPASPSARGARRDRRQSRAAAAAHAGGIRLDPRELAIELDDQAAHALVRDQHVRAGADDATAWSRSRAQASSSRSSSARAGAGEIARRRRRCAPSSGGPAVVALSISSPIILGSSRPSASMSPAPITSRSRPARAATRAHAGLVTRRQPVGWFAGRRVDRRLGDRRPLTPGKSSAPRAPGRRRAPRRRPRRRARRRTPARARACARRVRLEDGDQPSRARACAPRRSSPRSRSGGGRSRRRRSRRWRVAPSRSKRRRRRRSRRGRAPRPRRRPARAARRVIAAAALARCAPGDRQVAPPSLASGSGSAPPAAGAGAGAS